MKISLKSLRISRSDRILLDSRTRAGFGAGTDETAGSFMVKSADCVFGSGMAEAASNSSPNPSPHTHQAKGLTVYNRLTFRESAVNMTVK